MSRKPRTQSDSDLTQPGTEKDELQKLLWKLASNRKSMKMRKAVQAAYDADDLDLMRVYANTLRHFKNLEFVQFSVNMIRTHLGVDAAPLVTKHAMVVSSEVGKELRAARIRRAYWQSKAFETTTAEQVGGVYALLLQDPTREHCVRELMHSRGILDPDDIIAVVTAMESGTQALSDGTL